MVLTDKRDGAITSATVTFSGDGLCTATVTLTRANDLVKPDSAKGSVVSAKLDGEEITGSGSFTLITTPGRTDLEASRVSGTGTSSGVAGELEDMTLYLYDEFGNAITNDPGLSVILVFM